MFDVIGFKALRESLGTAGLYQKYIHGVSPAIAHSAAGRSRFETRNGEQVCVPDFEGSTIKHRTFSDSVILYTSDDSFESFYRLIFSSFQLLQFGFMGLKAPFRGAIGWGDLIDDPQRILLGSAIEDAYSGESQQAWAGAMLTPGAVKFAEENDYIGLLKRSLIEHARIATDEVTRQRTLENTKMLVRYPVPTQDNPKDGPVKYQSLDTYVIDWTIRMYEGASAASFNESISKHANVIAENTHKFESWARNR
jgi:hypothetical protein